MPRDEPRMARTLSSWIARVVVPVLANQAAGLEIRARRWVEDGGPRRRVLRDRLVAQPVGAVVTVGGMLYLLSVVGKRRRT